MARTYRRRVHAGRPRSTGPILAKVAKTGGIVTEVCLNGGHTVEDAFKAAELEYSGSEKIRVNGRPADLDTNLKTGDIVTLAGKITGGSI